MNGQNYYPSITNWDDAYDNASYIQNASQFPSRWNQQADTFRNQMADRAQLDIHYGPKRRQRLDLFLPKDESTIKGLLVFVHGGYWRSFYKKDWSHLAQSAVSQNWAVAIPSYTLAPEARISEMTCEIAAAITKAASLVPTSTPIHLTGHSAGGHLVTRVLCGPLLSESVQQRIMKLISISGIHDLRPLLNTQMNHILQLDEAEAIAESPALQVPSVKAKKLICLVGSEERPEFIRQSALLANIWAGLGMETRLVIAEKKHHFDVIDALTDDSNMDLFLSP